jgi:hypothetical protein
LDKKPLVGDIVHYTGILKYPWAAIIVAIKEELVQLCMFNPISDPQTKREWVPYSKEYKLNHWSWPPEGGSMEWQRCPVCFGTGIVYDMQAGQPPPNSSVPTTQFTCSVCKGEKIIRTDNGLPPSMQGKRNESK